MANVLVLGSPKAQFFNPTTGVFLAGGLLYSYTAGTTTPCNTYSTIADAVAATNPNSNPVVLDSTGSSMVVLSGGTKLVLTDSVGNQVWAIDNLNTFSSGNTTIGGSLGITGALTVNTTASITGNTSIGGNVAVTGSSTLTGNAALGGTLSVAGATTLTGNTSLGGTFAVGGASTLTGNASLGGTATITGNTSVGGTLGVTGASTLTGNATLGGTMSVAGATTLSSTAAVTGNTTIGGTLGVTGASTLTGNTSIGGTLAVTGTSTLTGAVSMPGGITGVTDASAAAAGKVGEILQSAYVTAVSMTTATVKQIQTLSLTAGDWDVWACFSTVPAATTTQSKVAYGLNLTTATLPVPTTFATSNIVQISTAIPANSPYYGHTGCYMLSVNATTSIFLNAAVTFATSTLTTGGIIYARRRR